MTVVPASLMRLKSLAKAMVFSGSRLPVGSSAKRIWGS